MNKKINPTARIGKQVIIDDYVVIGAQCSIGDNCKIHYFSYIDDGVHIGANCKIQNNVMIPAGVKVEEGVFIGPNAVFTNDKNPRAITPNGTLKTSTDWTLSETQLKTGCSIGAGAIIVSGTSIGKWAMIGAGALVCKNVPDHALVIGSPAKIEGWVDKSGYKMELIGEDEKSLHLYSNKEDKRYTIPK